MKPHARLEVIAGPMFSGKSAELIRRVELATIAKLSVVVVRPKLDTRISDLAIISRSGARIQAQVADNTQWLLGYNARQLDLLAIDEAQFFDAHLPEAVARLVRAGVRVIAAGLDLDYATTPFGPMPALLAMADDVLKLTAVCHRCRSLYATRTQRLVGGRAARAGEQIVIDRFDKHVGKFESIATYEARCLGCYEPPDGDAKSE